MPPVFDLLLTNPRQRWWLLLYLAGWGSLGAALGLLFDAWGAALTRISPLLTAGLGVGALLLFGGGLYLFERLQAAIREPVRITIWPDGVAAFYVQSGSTQSWQFAQLRAYKYQCHSTDTFLLLALRGGGKVKWQTGDCGFATGNTDAFAAMAQAFEVAWVRYQQARRPE